MALPFIKDMARQLIWKRSESLDLARSTDVLFYPGFKNKEDKQTQEKQNRRKIGSDFEDMAAEYLSGKGMEILYRNYRCHFGEIDLIARDGRTIVFIEVKGRRSARGGDPMDAVGLSKQLRICRSAVFFLATKYHDTDLPCRFDVIGVEGKQIRHVRDAFSFHI